MEDEISLDINMKERNHSWVVEVDEKLKNMASIPDKKLLTNTKSTKSSIYKLPTTVREKQRDSYAPCIVSFGPYYHCHESCVRTQNIKERVLLYSLRRSNKTTDDYVKSLSEVVQDLKDAYRELDQKWKKDNNAFLQMMIYDGCFMLEIVNEAKNWAAANRWGRNEYDFDNPIWGIDGISPSELMECYRHDILLLENQIPMLVLEKLFAVQTVIHFSCKGILEFVLPNVSNMPRKDKFIHALDLCRHSLLHEELFRFGDPLKNLEFALMITASLPRRYKLVLFLCGLPIFLLGVICSLVMFLIYALLLFLICLFKFLRCPLKLLRYLLKNPSPLYSHFNIPSATDLKNVGIGFSMSKSTILMDISFGRRTLRLPQIFVDGATKTMFLNIIAFEQLRADAKAVTSYICFMGSLLQGVDDVRLLQLHGIICTTLSGSEVAELFDSMSRRPKISLVEKYVEVGRTLTEHFNKMSDEWQRDLWQNYLRSPWAIISLIAAFIIFITSIVQTVYTILSYNNRK